jgi:hypothetical protein
MQEDTDPLLERDELREIIRAPEKAFLVGIGLRRSFPLLSVEESLEELSLLEKTAGMNVVGETHQNLN